MKPLLLDLFCGAGGAAVGYHRAGFDVLGVDIAPQPNYPFEFIQADAIEVLGYLSDYGVFRWHEVKMTDLHLALSSREVSAVHASPPCQAYTAYRRKGHGVGNGYPKLIEAVRNRLRPIRMIYVIENVPGAPLDEPLTYCGSMFGLDVRRHRLFESNYAWWMEKPECDHAAQRARGKRFPGATNRDGRYTCEVGVWRIPLEAQKQAMGVDWDCTLEELSEMVPPAYTEHIGRQLLRWINEEAAA